MNNKKKVFALMSLKDYILNFKKYQYGLFQAIISVNVNC